MKYGFLALTLTLASLCAHAENIHPFTSDGCSSSPDSIFGHSIIHCCVAHDFDYWLGGTRTQKQQADENLKQCIQAAVPAWEIVGTVYKLGVIIGGSPRILDGINSPFPWRWGYGWGQNHGYLSSTKAELLAGLDELEKMDANLDAQERAVNVTNSYAWRLKSLKFSHKEFKQIRTDLKKKIDCIQQALFESENKIGNEMRFF